MEHLVDLADAIEALRAELTTAWQRGKDQPIHFRPTSVQLTVQLAITKGGKGTAGVKWWLVEAGGEASLSRVTTHGLTLTLEPWTLDENLKPVPPYIGDRADPEEQG
jgi:hypothetical protein